jgi:recombination protein RecR
MNQPIGAAPPPVSKLIDEFHRLPGIGPKSAQRLTYHLLRIPAEDAVALAQAIIELKERTVLCSVCQNVTETDPCAICRDEGRDRTSICVVEEPLRRIRTWRARRPRCTSAAC